MATFEIEIGYKVPLMMGLASLKWTFADDSVVRGVGAGFSIRDPLLRPATLKVEGLGASGLELAVEGDGSQQVGDGLLVSWWQDASLDRGGFHFTFTTVREEVQPAIDPELPMVAEPAVGVGLEPGLPDVAGPAEAAGG